ncbi:hypothetical protein [uncultured Paludibaculum sp.]|uniref:hypothetical protein n=1 Tax=uncultured Paludibaculum sp. TaxID=1765020 RepID=UPI002AAC2FBF|nr:hypothetical protein [uncultured Paludibaculum sp.]
MNDPAESATNPQPIPDEAVRFQLETILGQEPFRESPTLQRLLRHIVDQTLATGGKDLKEYSLGVSVFKRGPEFDPRTDSIVRVQVGVLRRKLAAYYGSQGQSDQVLIEIPRGHYTARFRSRSDESVEAPAQTLRRSRTRDLLLAGAGLLIGLLLWIPFRNPASAPTQPFEWQQHPLWHGFFDSDSSTQLVMGAPMFVMVNGMYVRDSTVNTPEDLAGKNRIRQLADFFHSTMRTEEIYTGLGEAAGLYTLGRFFTRGGKELPLVRNRLARWQDVAHGNLVLFSSFRFRSLGQELPLPRDFEFDGPHTAINNVRPRQGEAAVYLPKFGDTGEEYDYAVISVWPSPQQGRRIMSLSGVYTWGTQGAAEYVVDPPSLRELGRRLQSQGIPQRDAGLQVLVKVLVKDRQPVATSYVTHHWLAEQPAR